MLVRVNGIDLSYDEAGSGMPVLWLHPFPLAAAYWRPQLHALHGRARCIAPDLRGFGASEMSTPVTIDQYADDAAVLLDVLGISRAVVAGLSMGGYVAFALWRRHRARVAGLLLADTRAGADTPEVVERRRALIALARREGSDAVAELQLPSLVGKTTRERHPEIVAQLRAIIAAAPAAGIVGAAEAMIARPDSTPTLATIDVPTTIVVGDEDVPTPPKEARAMHAAIAGSRVEVIAGAGHASSFERPAAFNHVVSELLDVVHLE